jgi:hypothetical protein
METNETHLKKSLVFDKARILDIYDEENIEGKSYQTIPTLIPTPFFR